MRRAWLLLAMALLLGACNPKWGRLATDNVLAWFQPLRRVPHKIHQPIREDARIAVLWVGHATMLVQLDDKLILTDPVFVDSVGQVSPRLVEPGLDIADVPHLHAVLISHMHFDHLSPKTLQMLEDRIGQVVVPEGGLVYLPDSPFAARELKWWQSFDIDGMRITAVPVEHTGFRYGVDGAWLPRAFTGYVVEYHGLTLYFGGDTAYAQPLFAETARRFPHIDLALLPIAPIEPRRFMGLHHVDPDEAVRAFLDLHADHMVPIHYDTFVNSADEPGDALRLLRAAVKQRGLTDAQVHVVDFGEQWVVMPREVSLTSP
jgi:N-acyl-phosphatidylethanolamine-hydrolysing phospholipase D